MIELAFIAYNRLEYTRKTLESVLADPSDSFTLTIWDNASTDGTREYLRDVSDPRIGDVVLSDDNIGQVAAVNTIWSRSKATLVGKLDNDCLMTPGWADTLAAAHEDIPELGVVACWHFFGDDFDEERAAHKIQTFGRHRIFRHPWTCGTGLLVKKRVYDEVGPIVGPGTTGYWISMAKAGYVNGFYYPLILQEHMDDPRSEHSVLQDDAALQAAKAHTVTVALRDQQTLADYNAWQERILRNLLDEPWDVKHYTGLRGFAWRLRNRFGRG